MLRSLLVLISLPFFLTACAGWSVEAPYVDREFGQGQRAAWDQQVAYTDGRYALETPESLAGIHGEKVMKSYHKSYERKTTQPETMTLGIVEGGGGQ